MMTLEIQAQSGRGCGSVLIEFNEHELAEFRPGGPESLKARVNWNILCLLSVIAIVRLY